MQDIRRSLIPLPDSFIDNPGSYVRPDITLAVIRMCREAGAKEIGVFKSLSNSNWRRSSERVVAKLQST
jgi:hypothetical protein